MTDLLIMIIGAGCALFFAGLVALCERVRG
jgi:hypothetical protein